MLDSALPGTRSYLAAPPRWAAPLFVAAGARETMADASGAVRGAVRGGGHILARVVGKYEGFEIHRREQGRHGSLLSPPTFMSPEGRPTATMVSTPGTHAINPFVFRNMT